MKQNLVAPVLLVLVILMVSLSNCNLWDNIWSNNIIDRIVFPRQFEFKISWNATIGNQSSANNTNYIQNTQLYSFDIQAGVKIDGHTNKIKIQSNFSTLSLQAQEFFSIVMDLNHQRLSLKQKESCKHYALKLSAGGDRYKDVKMPNIADIFDLWPYIMYYNETKNEQSTNGMIEFMYSYPLGEKKAKDSDIIVYFDKQNLELKQFTIRANSLNITNQLVLYAVQPITEVYFEPNDLEFAGLNCTEASESEQSRLDYYVERVIDIIFNT